MAQDYKFELQQKARVGQTQLLPGKYIVSVNGETVVLKDKAGNTIDVKAKVEQTSAKASGTSVRFSQDRQQLTSVSFGGTQTRVIFE